MLKKQPIKNYIIILSVSAACSVIGAIIAAVLRETDNFNTIGYIIVCLFELGSVVVSIIFWIYMCTLSNNINVFCDGDGNDTTYFLTAMIISYLTLGIYGIVWFCKAIKRFRDNANRYNPPVYVESDLSSFLLWYLLGSIIVVGPIIAMIKFIKDANKFIDAYNYAAYPAQYGNQSQQNAMEYNNYDYNQNNYNNNQNYQQQAYQNNSYAIDETPTTTPATGYSPADRMGAIKGVNGMYAGFEIPIQIGESITIGTNSAKSNVVISEGGQYVSSSHCTIQYNPMYRTYTITDHSTNGTFTINGQRMPKNTPIDLQCGEEFYLGDTSNSFKLQ